MVIFKIKFFVKVHSKFILKQYYDSYLHCQLSKLYRAFLMFNDFDVQGKYATSATIAIRGLKITVYDNH